MKHTTKRERRIQTHRKNMLHERRRLVLIAGNAHKAPAEARKLSAQWALQGALQAAFPAWRPRIPRSMRRLAKRICDKYIDRLIAGMGKPCSREEFRRRNPNVATGDWR